MSNISSELRRSFQAAALCALALALCTLAAQAQTFSTPPQNISGAGSGSHPVMVVDAAGGIDVAWIDSASGINFTRSINAGVSFLPPVSVGVVSVGATFQPQMIVDSTGTVIEIAWAKPSTAAGAPAGTFDVFVSRSANSGLVFTTTTAPISATPAVLVDSPRLAFDGAGVDVVWGNTQTWISQSGNGISFGAPITLSLPNTPQDSGGPRIAVDKNGNIFVAWTDRLAQDQNKPGNFCTNQMGTRDANGVLVFSNAFGGNLYLNEAPAGTQPSYASTRNLSSSDWKGTESYPYGYFGCSYDSLQLFFDQNNNLHLLWAVDTPSEDLLASTAAPQASGSPLFSFPINLAGDEGASSPSAAADSKGSIYVVWAAGAAAPSNTEGIYFSRSDNDGTTFPEATVVSAPGVISPAFPQIGLDSSRNVNIVWEQADQTITASGGNTFHLFFARSSDQGSTFPTVREVFSGNPSVMCIPVTTSGTPPTTPDRTTCGVVQVGVNTDSNADIAWVNNPGSAASIDFSVAQVTTQPHPDFSISVSPASQTAYAGRTVNFSVTAQTADGFTDSITLGCNDFPEFTAQGVSIKRSDFSCTSTPASITPGGSATVAVTIPPDLPANPSATPYTFAISGTSGGTTHRIMLAFNSQGPAGSVQPTSATLAVGASANFNVSINPGAFTGTVSFQCAGQPAWIQCAFNPGSINPSSSTSSVLTVTVLSAPSRSVMSYSRLTRGLPLQGQRVLWTTFAALGLVTMAMIFVPRRGNLRTASLLRGFAVMALVLVLSIGLVSCGGAAAKPSAAANNSSGGGTGGSGGSGGSGSNPVTTTFMIQGQSGDGITNLGAVSITAQ